MLRQLRREVYQLAVKEITKEAVYKSGRSVAQADNSIMLKSSFVKASRFVYRLFSIG